MKIRQFFSDPKHLAVLHAILFCIVLAAVTVMVWPLFRALSTPEGQKEVLAYISSLGLSGCLIMLGIQILQVIIAIIPGEPVEILMGALYGTWGGFFLCEAGLLIGSCCVFFAVHLLGAPLVRALFGEEKLGRYRFLQNTERFEAITFLLFFIPGTPKDLLIYAAGLTPIRPLRFLVIATVARIPSVLSSTWGGSSFLEGDWRKTALIFAAVGTVSLCGALIHKKLMVRFRRDTE